MRKLKLVSVLLCLLLTACSKEKLPEFTNAVANKDYILSALDVKDESPSGLANTRWGSDLPEIVNLADEWTIENKNMLPTALDVEKQENPSIPRVSPSRFTGKVLVTYDSTNINMPDGVTVELYSVNEELNQVIYKVSDVKGYVIVSVTNFPSVNECIEAGKLLQHELYWNDGYAGKETEYIFGVKSDIPIYAISNYGKQRLVSVTCPDFEETTFKLASSVLDAYMSSAKIQDEYEFEDINPVDVKSLHLTHQDQYYVCFENHEWDVRIDTTRVNLKSETEFNFGVYGEISDVYSDGITRYVLQFDDWTAVLRYKQSDNGVVDNASVEWIGTVLLSIGGLG